MFLKLSDPSDLPKNAFRIFSMLVEFLCIEHIDYALETGLAGKHNCVRICTNVLFNFVLKGLLCPALKGRGPATQENLSAVMQQLN